jgi:hypothetical protein
MGCAGARGPRPLGFAEFSSDEPQSAHPLLPAVDHAARACSTLERARPTCGAMAARLAAAIGAGGSVFIASARTALCDRGDRVVRTRRPPRAALCCPRRSNTLARARARCRLPSTPRRWSVAPRRCARLTRRPTRKRRAHQTTHRIAPAAAARAAIARQRAWHRCRAPVQLLGFVAAVGWLLMRSHPAALCAYRPGAGAGQAAGGDARARAEDA